MSLDVYLTRKKWISYDGGETLTEDSPEILFSANITHNLTEMASEANLYEALWRPYRLVDGYNASEGNYDLECEFEEKQTIKANQIITIIEKGLEDLKARPNHFKKFDSPNGWGLYIHFVPFVEEYLNACKEYPDSIVNVSR